MKSEVEIAAKLVVSYAIGLNEAEREKFKQTLVETLCLQYQKHWYPTDPGRGSAYRCFGVGPSMAMNPVMASVLESSGLADFHIDKIFPQKIMIWVNPNKITYAVWVDEEDDDDDDDHYDEDDGDDVYDECDDEYEDNYGF